MKRNFVLLMVALMSAVMVNAKTVRGYVSDKEGNPVVGMKMVVVNADNPSKKSVAVTDEQRSPGRQIPGNIHGNPDRDRTVPKEGKGIGTEVMSGHGDSE